MTAAQVARLAAQTGDWTEPLSNGFSGSVMYDDGSIGRVEGLGRAEVLTILSTGSADATPKVEREIPTGAFVDREALNAPVVIGEVIQSEESPAEPAIPAISEPEPPAAEPVAEPDVIVAPPAEPVVGG